MPETTTEIIRTCRDCQREFTVTEDEIRGLHEIAKRAGWPEVRIPGRCYSCRRLSREAPHVVVDDGRDEWVTCIDCGVTFIFGGRDREYFARNHYCTPKRCRPCRRARAARR